MKLNNVRCLLDELVLAGSLLDNGAFGLIVDIDGTISPIAPTPKEARVSPVCRHHLRALSKQLPLVAAVSGRPAREARRIVGIPEMVYVGNHGFERLEKGRVLLEASVSAYRKPLEEALSELRSILNRAEFLIEDKGATASIHYRLAADQEAARKMILEKAAVAAEGRGLKVTEGRMVVEIRPPVEADKGTAVLQLVEANRLQSALYLGDDITDLAAFAVLRSWRERGLGESLSVAVTSPESREVLIGSADAFLNGVDDVERFLAWLSEEVARRASTGPQAGDRATS